jgi:hypothetical protein
VLRRNATARRSTPTLARIGTTCFRMTPDRYRSLLSDYDQLLDHAKAVSARLVGRKLESRELSYADAIYTKLICHGISLRKLSPTLADGELWDVASASAVARALIEAYDALAYIVVQPASKEDREFRMLLWELHDQQRRLRMLEKVKSKNPQVEGIRLRASSILYELKQHELFSTLPRDLQAKVLRGDAPPVHLSQRELNAASGVNHDYYTAATMFLSQYVHTFPMSLRQLMQFRAGDPDALGVSSMPLQYCMPFLAKAIEGAVHVWPDGRVDRSEGFQVLLRNWLAIAEKGVSNAG